MSRTKEELLSIAVAEKTVKLNSLRNLHNLLNDFLSKETVTFHITSYKISIAYEDFTEGYEAFIPLLVSYIQEKVDAM